MFLEEYDLSHLKFEGYEKIENVLTSDAETLKIRVSARKDCDVDLAVVCKGEKNGDTPTPSISTSLGR